MSYQVFARKYRPQTFSEVVGQEHVVRTLQNAIAENRVAQAYLFVGSRGIGKTSTARILAKALNCAGGTTADPCGTCDSCIEVAEGRNLDVIEIDGASNNGVENIRDLRESAIYAPTKSPYKIYMIDEVHMLSTGAFNALLKTLEEPPPHVKFIFATTEAQKVPATITSRCQRFDLRRISAEAIASHLLAIATNEKITLDPAAAASIARAATGGMRDAESMLDQAVAFCGNQISEADIMQIFGFTAQEVVAAFVAEGLLARDTRRALEIVAEQDRAGRDLSRLMAEIVAHLRDLLVQAAADPRRREEFLTLLDHFGEAETRLRWASDKKLQFDIATIKAIHLLEQASLDDILDTLAAMRSGDATAVPIKRSQESGSKTAPCTIRSQYAGAKKTTPSEIPVPASSPSSSSTGVHAAVETLDMLATETTVSPPPSTPSLSPEAAAWKKVKAASQGLLSRWLCDGIYDRTEGDKIYIAFPATLADTVNSLTSDPKRREAQTAMTTHLGRKITLVFEISHTLEESKDEEAIAEPPASAPETAVPSSPSVPSIPSPPSTPTSPDVMQSFKNDPLIQEAVDLFKGELR